MEETSLRARIEHLQMEVETIDHNIRELSIFGSERKAMMARRLSAERQIRMLKEGENTS
jgi:hypothetical protein